MLTFFENVDASQHALISAEITIKGVVASESGKDELRMDIRFDESKLSNIVSDFNATQFRQFINGMVIDRFQYWLGEHFLLQQTEDG